MATAFLIFALGVIAGTVVAIGRDIFSYYFFRPRLSIGTDRPEVAEAYTCHSLIIRNTGRRTAHNAQGFISFEHIEPEDLIQEPNLLLGRDLGFDPIKFGVRGEETVYLKGRAIRQIDEEPLCWSAVDSRSVIDIHPNTGRLLDVCRFIKVRGREQVHIPSSLGWQALLVALKPKQYRIRVRVVARGASPVVRDLRLVYDGQDIQLNPSSPEG